MDVLFFIAISVLSALQEIGLQQLWISFGHEQNPRRVPTHDLCLSLGSNKSRGLFLLHTFSGCDVFINRSVAKGRSLHGKPWMCVIKRLTSSANSVTAHQQWMTMTLKPWISLWSWYMTDPIQLRVSMTRGWTRLLENRGRTKPFLLLGQLYSTLHVLPTRQAVYGVSQQYVSQNHRVPLTGDGPRKVICGRSSGPSFHLLQKLVSDWPSVDASQNVMGNTNAITLVWLALHYAAADARLRIY